jgi:undecaprenyl diphosphate synthase
MSRPVTLFLALLCIPLIHKLYATIGSAHFIAQGSLKHLAIIMDGNRRWAQQRNLISTMGHQKGAETVKTLIKFCLSRKIEIVSVYAFSLENFKRSPEEVQGIFNIIVDETESTLPDLIKQGIKVRFIGEIQESPEKVQQAIKRIEENTKECNKLLLNVLLCYGGRQEILSAIKKIVQDVKEGKLDNVPSEETFKQYLWTSDLPDPDLIIRTGGERRLSNFLTYQTSYSELYFTDRFWPELTFQDFDEAVHDYYVRNRNLGR